MNVLRTDEVADVVPHTNRQPPKPVKHVVATRRRQVMPAQNPLLRAVRVRDVVHLDVVGRVVLFLGYGLAPEGDF